jgi:hypothetical protein
MPASRDEVFRAFCHINDYGTYGFAELHRMIAVSKPLILWGPSSVLLLNSGARVSERDFLDLLESGQVRIIGRYKWILSKNFRDGHVWEGAKWTAGIDAHIRKIAEEDETKPLYKRRVILADDATGDEQASRYIDEHPEVVGTVSGALAGPTARNDFPVQVLNSVARHGDDPRARTQVVLGHAYNHGDAIGLSGADAPFFLEPHDSRFVRLLAQIRDTQEPPHRSPGEGSSEPLSIDDLARVTEEVRDLLRHLESAGSTNLKQFIESDGNALLATWTGELCRSLADERAQRVDGSALKRLQREFEAGELEDGWSDIFMNRDGLIGSVGTAAGVLEAALTSQVTIFGAIGLAAGAYEIGQGMLRKLGYASTEYSGPQWPFLYTFGAKASRRRREKLRRVLDTLVPSES